MATRSRPGPAILDAERLIAAVRVDAGDSIDAIMADYRVTKATAKQWLARHGDWHSVRWSEPSELEIDAGYQAEYDDREMWRLVRGDEWSPDRARRAVADHNRRLFVALLADVAELDDDKLPPLETIERTYRMLDEQARAEFSPAWDLLLLAADEIAAALAKFKRIAELADVDARGESEAA